MRRVKWVCGLMVAAGMYVVRRTVRRRRAEAAPRLSRSDRKAARKAAVAKALRR